MKVSYRAQHATLLAKAEYAFITQWVWDQEIFPEKAYLWYLETIAALRFIVQVETRAQKTYLQDRKRCSEQTIRSNITITTTSRTRRNTCNWINADHSIRGVL